MSLKVRTEIQVMAFWVVTLCCDMIKMS